jgi:hypothetical protein
MVDTTTINLFLILPVALRGRAESKEMEAR